MKKVFLYGGLAVLSLTSCKLDDNIDPNTPLISSIPPKQMLAAAETGNFAAQAGSMFSLSRIWTNTVAGNFYQYAAPMTLEYQMNLTASNYGAIWTNNYLNLSNLYAIGNNKDAASYPNHVAISKILLANGMQYLVDWYGDVPYSEAFQQQGNISPKYDKGEDIYKDLVLQINQAIALIDASANVSAYEVGAEDVILHGDMDTWKKVANTIKLRLLLRQSKVTDPAIQSFVNSELATLVGASFVDSDITINPGYTNQTEAQMNPLYYNYGAFNFTQTAWNNAGYRYYKASEFMANNLEGTIAGTAGVKDPRGAKQYRNVGGKVVGIRQGMTKLPNTADGNYSYPGGWMYQNAAPGSEMDGYVFLKSEVELLLAEAAVSYPGLFSGAKTHYDNAVNESFTFFGLTGAQATAYLTARMAMHLEQ